MLRIIGRKNIFTSKIIGDENDAGRKRFGAENYEGQLSGVKIRTMNFSVTKICDLLPKRKIDYDFPKHQEMSRASYISNFHKIFSEFSRLFQHFKTNSKHIHI